jgi:hypothetical protein
MFNHGTQQFEGSFCMFNKYCGKQHHDFATIGRKSEGMYFVLNVQAAFMCIAKKLGFIIWFKIVHQVYICLNTFVFNLCFMDRGQVQWPWLWMLHGLSLTIDYATREETFSS